MIIHAGALFDVAEHDRVDRLVDGAESGVADNADDLHVGDAGVGREWLALDDLADRVLRRFETELPHGIFVEHDVHAARRERLLLLEIGRKLGGHVVHRPVRVEPAAGLQGQAHRIEKALVDIILADQDLLVAARRDDVVVIVVGRVDPDVRAADGRNSRDPLHPLDDRSRPRPTAGRGLARRPGGCGRACSRGRLSARKPSGRR